MGRVLIIIAVVLLTIYCTVEVAQSSKYAVRNAPKWLWAVLVICVPVGGAIAWLFLGRPNGRSRPQGRPERRNPDDDPDFLRGL